jgi:hypothetical protein
MESVVRALMGSDHIGRERSAMAKKKPKARRRMKALFRPNRSSPRCHAHR